MAQEWNPDDDWTEVQSVARCKIKNGLQLTITLALDQLVVERVYPDSPEPQE